MQPVEIGKADWPDIPRMVALLERLFSIEEDFQFSPERQQSGLRQLIDSPSGTILVARTAGRIIGMVTGQIIISTAEGGPALLVEDLVVDARDRRKGVGRLLLEHIAAWAGRRGARRMQLLADRGNSSAIDFYRIGGWQRTQLICLRKYRNESQP